MAGDFEGADARQAADVAASPRALPAGWEVKTLGEVCEYDKANLSENTDKDYQFKYISLSDVDRGRLLDFSILKFGEAPSRARRVVKQGDVLMATVRPNLQAFYIFREAVSDVIVSTGYCVLSPGSQVVSGFLYQYLYSSQMLRIFDRFNVGTSYPAINSGDIKNFPIILPPLPEQKAIADTLALWDEAIETAELLISAKQQRFRWLLQTLISAPAESGEPGWAKVKLEQLLDGHIKIEKGKALTQQPTAEGHIPVVAGGKKYPYYTDTPTHTAPTVTISSSGSAGYVWYHDYPIWASDCIVLQASGAPTAFVYFALKLAQQKIYALQSGGVVPHVYAKDIITLSIPWPSVKKQRQIAGILLAAREEIDLLQKLAAQYKKQKHGLMQKLLTGEWRVE